MNVKNIASYTAPGPAPAYISINEIESGDISITVRNETGQSVSVDMPRDFWKPMAEAILRHLEEGK